MNDPAIQRLSTTEEAPAAPGWAEDEFDDIFACLPDAPALGSLRAAYLDCLAGIAGPADIDGAHDRCRAALLRGLEAERVAEDDLRRVDARLAALEAEISART